MFLPKMFVLQVTMIPQKLDVLRKHNIQPSGVFVIVHILILTKSLIMILFNLVSINNLIENVICHIPNLPYLLYNFHDPNAQVYIYNLIILFAFTFITREHATKAQDMVFIFENHQDLLIMLGCVCSGKFMIIKLWIS